MRWSDWRPFPDPRAGEMLVAPIGPGCYELRRIEGLDLVLCGSAGHVAKRMSALLPEPHGTGKDSRERAYCLEHVADLEYRTAPCPTRDDAKQARKAMVEAATYVFDM